MKRRILIVEDERSLVRSLADRLSSEGYSVSWETDGPSGLQAGLSRSHDVILLDVMLPGKQGFEVCRELRDAGVDAPILMLTARGHTADKVLGLRFGADDYVTKPFEMVELLARLDALLRRAGRDVTGPDLLTVGMIRMDLRRGEVHLEDREIDLTVREFNMLRFMMTHVGHVLTREDLLQEVWGYRHAPVTRTVDVHMARLRQKLEENPSRPRYLTTVHGVGYKLVDPGRER